MKKWIGHFHFSIRCKYAYIFDRRLEKKKTEKDIFSLFRLPSIDIDKHQNKYEYGDTDREYRGRKKDK